PESDIETGVEAGGSTIMNTWLPRRVAVRSLCVIAAVAALATLALPVLAQEEVPAEPVPGAPPAEIPPIAPPPEDDRAAPAEVVVAPTAPVGPVLVEGPTPTAVPGISEAQQHFAQGLERYHQGLYREALEEFNRAHALDPNLVSAQEFARRAEAQLQQAAI